MDLYRQKKEDCWLWWAIDRASKSVLGWTLGDRGTETAERLAAQLPHAPHIKYATAFCHPSPKSFGAKTQAKGKPHPFPTKTLNTRTPCYRARLKRRTHN